MNELHGYGSFSDAGSHAFDGTVAHIAHGKDAGNIGLQQKRISFERPAFRVLPVADKIGAGQKETAFVALDDICEKIRARQGSNEDEHCARRYAFDFSGVGAEHGNFFEMGFAVDLGDAGMGPELNVRRLFNLVDQIL